MAVTGPAPFPPSSPYPCPSPSPFAFPAHPSPSHFSSPQELSSTLGLVKLSERLNDPTCQEWYDGIFPKVGPQRAGQAWRGGSHTRVAGKRVQGGHAHRHCFRICCMCLGPVTAADCMTSSVLAA